MTPLNVGPALSMVEEYYAKKKKVMNLPLPYLEAFMQGYEAGLGPIRKFLYDHSLMDLPPEVRAVKDVLKKRTELSDKL
jgi:hypothetical protein